MSPSAPIDARASRDIEASAERIFDAWTEPAMVGRWMFGPAVRDEEVVSLSIELRVGGTFSFAVRRQGTVFDHIGEYLEIERPRRLVFTWAVKEDKPQWSRVAVDIAPAARGCGVTVTQQLHPDRRDFKARAEEAWAKMLAALAKALA